MTTDHLPAPTSAPAGDDDQAPPIDDEYRSTAASVDPAGSRPAAGDALASADDDDQAAPIDDGHWSTAATAGRRVDPAGSRPAAADASAHRSADAPTPTTAPDEPDIPPPPIAPVPPPLPPATTLEGLTLRVGDNPHLRALAAARRRLYRPTIDRVAAELLRTLDVDGFNRRFRDSPLYRSFGGRGSSKYIDLEPWIRVNVDHWFSYGFNRLPVGTRLLDIGCGSGFFLLVCRHFGLRPLGLDMDGDPLYNEQIEFFGLERIVHTVQPGDFLPDVGATRFDVVTSFMAAFNEYRDWTPWGVDEWNGFLPALRQTMAADGRGLFWLNRNLLTGRYYSAEVHDAIASHPGFRARFFANCLRLDAR